MRKDTCLLDHWPPRPIRATFRGAGARGTVSWPSRPELLAGLVARIDSLPGLQAIGTEQGILNYWLSPDFDAFDESIKGSNPLLGLSTAGAVRLRLSPELTRRLKKKGWLLENESGTWLRPPRSESELMTVWRIILLVYAGATRWPDRPRRALLDRGRSASAQPVPRMVEMTDAVAVN